MRTEDTAGNVYIPSNCDCGLTGGCWKCNPSIVINIPEYYYFPQYYPPAISPHFCIHTEIRCPNCGKILKPHVCGED